MRTEEKLRVMSQTQHCKRFVEQFKDEFTQKKMFETCKKAKEVEEFRTTHSRRLQLINQSVKDRKFM